MELVVSILLGLALAMDCFAVSVCIGGVGEARLREHITVPLYFGAFQGAMLALGYGLGSIAHSTVARLDHWIAFALLAGIGAKLIIDSCSGQEQHDLTSPRKLLLFSIATSIDAFVAGFALSLTSSPIIAAALIVALITAIVSIIGLQIGHRIKQLRINYAGIAGGIVLISLGVKILIGHLA